MANYKYFNVHAEAGPGRYFTPFNDYPWGAAISVKLLSTPLLTKIPVELHYYRISPNVVNNNAVFWNTTIVAARIIDEPRGGLQSPNVLNPFASSIVQIGQMTNNRTGISVNTEFDIKKLRVSAGYNVSTEIDAVQNRITFSHFVNQLTRSRFWRWDFPVDVGPYGRYDKVYRDAYETVELTDDSLGFAVNPKRFNSIEVHGKYKTKIGNKNFYAFILGRYYTAQSFLSAVPVFSDRAYLRQYSTELEMYYQITNQVFLNSYLGYERNIGNYNTALNFDSFKPLDQTGWGIGVGMDINLGRNAGLYLRYRWFYFEDENFALDTFRGQETLVELKVFF
jgi:opacity protein-like surface antigen